MQGMPEQLALSIRLRADARFDEFKAGGNAVLLDALKRFCAPDSREQMIYISGPAGSGRSHLLQACCHEIETRGGEAIYLPSAELELLQPAVFESLEQFDLICIDDLHRLLGQPLWEEALFHLYNRVRDAGMRLIIAADQPPAYLNLQLEDLRSRLSWGAVFQLAELSDEDKVDALRDAAQSRGLAVSDEALRFLLNHGRRDMAALMQLLDQLDQASLSAKRRLTIPFIKQVLDWN